MLDVSRMRTDLAPIFLSASDVPTNALFKSQVPDDKLILPLAYELFDADSNVSVMNDDWPKDIVVVNSAISNVAQRLNRTKLLWDGMVEMLLVRMVQN